MGHRRGALIIITGLLMSLSSLGQARELRVCADPNNLPFSNQARAGFENKLIDLVARDLNATVVYEWWAQRRGNVRETLKAGRCEVIPGIASNLEMLATTRPYYRSSYVFVTRADRKLTLEGFDDERLKSLRLGVQMIGDDFSNTPPAHSLARRGMVQNVRGFMVYGDYATDSPSRTIVDAVAKGEIDVAVVWGPLAGYYARKAQPALAIQPVAPLIDGPMLPMTFDISMGVRKEDRALRRELDDVLERRRDEVRALLEEYGVPLRAGVNHRSVASCPVCRLVIPTGTPSIPRAVLSSRRKSGSPCWLLIPTKVGISVLFCHAVMSCHPDEGRDLKSRDPDFHRDDPERISPR